MTGRLIAMTAAAALLSGCGEEPQATEKGSEQVPAALNPGEYEVTTVVEDLRSTDGTTPATKSEAAKNAGEPITHRACVMSDGSVEPTMFSEPGDECRIENAYARNGRLQLSLSCTRPGSPGQVMQGVDGKFTADSFEAVVNTGTYFTGAGDYAMRRKMTGKRTGDCATKPGDEKAS